MKATLSVEGMTCSCCVGKVEKQSIRWCLFY